MKIRVGTFNLYQFVKPPYFWYDEKSFFKKDGWIQKRAWIKNQVKKMDCDVIAFQEVFSVEELKELVLELGFEHFCVVDTPRVAKENELIFISSVVALASKHEILSVDGLEVIPEVLNEVNLTEDEFKFSRVPIKAKIEFNGFGETLFYVCHLKSNLPIVKNEILDSDSKEYKAYKSMQGNSIGYTNSMQQRGAEASCIYFDISASLHANKKRPIILLGDFNDKEDSAVLKALTNGSFETEELEDGELFDFYKLYDSYELAKNTDKKRRSVTNYFKNKGECIDFIFLSEHFKEEFDSNIYVEKLEFFDAHIHQNRYECIRKSDHAQVVCELKSKD